MFNEQYKTDTITGDDVFYYAYGVLHNPEYKTKFAADLKKTLPRIPFAKTFDDFQTYAAAGRKLAELHVGYETVEPYLVREEAKNATTDAAYYRVTKMAYRTKADKSVIIYNSNITISDIPPEAHEYIVNGKSALDWIIDRYRIKDDKASQITNDANDWSENPRYIIELIKKVITVSVETVQIVKTLPKLF